MRHDAYLVWSWSPQYLLASRWEPPGAVEPVEPGKAVGIIERLARSNPAALRTTWVATGAVEPEQARAMSIEQLCRRLQDELERPTGRLGLYQRHDAGAMGQLGSDLDAEIIDLVALAGDESEGE